LALSADGTVAAELDTWLAERELDVQQTTVANYRDVIRCYVNPHVGAGQLYTIDKRIVHDLYQTLHRRGSRNGGPCRHHGADRPQGADESLQGSGLQPRGRSPTAARLLEPGQSVIAQGVAWRSKRSRIA
jgi:hypothetical protein